jgi:hypothetical protein
MEEKDPDLVGRRLEYKFEVAGQERWFPGVITRVSASTDWYDVSFDDGEKCCVRIVRLMQGVVWRWAIGTYGDDREGGGCARQAAVAACSSTTHAAGASARGDSPSARAAAQAATVRRDASRHARAMPTGSHWQAPPPPVTGMPAIGAGILCTCCCGVGKDKLHFPDYIVIELTVDPERSKKRKDRGGESLKWCAFSTSPPHSA